MENGVTVGIRVLVAVGVRIGVLVKVGVLVGLGVRVLVGVLEGRAGVLLGGMTVTIRVMPGVVVSTTSMIIIPAVPTVVGVGRRSTVGSGGPKSHATNARRAHAATRATTPNTRPIPAPAPAKREDRNMALMITYQGEPSSYAHGRNNVRTVARRRVARRGIAPLCPYSRVVVARRSESPMYNS